MADKNKNLIPQQHKLTLEEQKAGGRASVKARRERKTLKEELLLMLSDEKVQEQVTAALIQKAIKGDVKAFEVLRDTVGEKPVEKVESTNTDIVIDFGSIPEEEK